MYELVLEMIQTYQLAEYLNEHFHVPENKVQEGLLGVIRVGFPNTRPRAEWKSNEGSSRLKIVLSFATEQEALTFKLTYL